MSKVNLLLLTKDEVFAQKAKSILSCDSDFYNSIIIINRIEEAISVIQEGSVDVLLVDMEKKSATISLEVLKVLYEKKNWIPTLAVRKDGAFNHEIFEDFGIVQTIEDIEEKVKIEEIIKQIGEAKQKSDYICGLNLSTILQILELEKKTCVVNIKNNYNKEGLIFFIDGKLEDAEFGNLSGLPAFGEILAMKDKIVSIKYIPHMRKKLGESASKLLMEFAFKEDETSISKKGGLQMNVKKLNEAIEAQKESLGPALISTDIVMTEDGQSIAGFNSNPKGAALFNQLTQMIVKTVKESGMPELGRYYILDLVDDKMAIVLYLGDFIWGMLIDKKKTQLGLLLNIVIPSMVDAFEAAIAS